MRIIDNPELMRLLVEAVDEKAERLELERAAHPDDDAILVDLKCVWDLQARLFGR